MVDKKSIQRINSKEMDSLLERFKTPSGSEYSECRNPDCRAADKPEAFVDGLCFQCRPKFDLRLRLQNSDEQLMTFEAYRVKADNKKAFEKAKAFIDSKSSLFFSGKAGRGKTHLMIASFIESIRRCRRSRIAYVTNWNHIERNAWETQGEAEGRMVDQALSCDLLYVDDLIPINVTNGLKEMLYMLLDGALKKGKPKIFATSNKGLSYISSVVDDRIGSRLAGLIGSDNDIVFADEIDDHRAKGRSK